MILESGNASVFLLRWSSLIRFRYLLTFTQPYNSGAWISARHAPLQTSSLSFCARFFAQSSTSSHCKLTTCGLLTVFSPLSSSLYSSPHERTDFAFCTSHRRLAQLEIPPKTSTPTDCSSFRAPSRLRCSDKRISSRS